MFNGLVNHIEGDTLFIKYPDRFTDIPLERFPKVLRISATCDQSNYMQTAGIYDKQKGSYPPQVPPVDRHRRMPDRQPYRKGIAIKYR